MNVFYCKSCSWELDYIKNDIFNNNLYKRNIKFIFFSGDSNCYKISNNLLKNKKNIIILNRSISVYYITKMIEVIKPIAIFHLSDEEGIDHKYYLTYKKYKINYLFHQYNFNINYGINQIQIPIGYATSFLSNKSSLRINSDQIKLKPYDFSFIGTIKSDRKEMIEKFSNIFKNNYVSSSSTNWSNPRIQKIKPNEMYKIYEKSLFIPIGRGFRSLDCFRLYECIVAGSIPVICGNEKEIKVSFNFNNKSPYLITAGTWDQVISKCKKIYDDKDKINEIVKFNHDWWKGQIFNISNIINKL